MLSREEGAADVVDRCCWYVGGRREVEAKAMYRKRGGKQGKQLQIV